jgi:HD superfamily phosphodiesterase
MSIIEESKAFVKNEFGKTDIKVLSYHNWKHTQNVLNAVELISENTDGVTEQQKEYLRLAAIFHDIGYLESPKEHEERGARKAGDFLEERNYDKEGIKHIQRLILATKLGHQPKDKLEEIIIDSDLSHLGREDYIDTTYKFLSNELLKNSKSQHTDKDWAESCIMFLSTHRFLTEFAKKHFGKTKQKNLEKVQELIKEKKESAENKEKVTPHKKGQKNPLKGVETMFKTALRNHVDLSAIADKKANTLISINSIIISIVLSALFPKLDSNPFLFYPSVTILSSCFITVILAILSTIPNVTRGVIGKAEVMEKKGNLLFFGNFHKMDLKDYEWSIQRLMESKDYIYGSMTRDLFFLGKVLNKKYQLLRWAYYIFMLGLLLSIIVFVINVMPYIGTTTQLEQVPVF